jgi:hypothetical protein
MEEHLKVVLARAAVAEGRSLSGLVKVVLREFISNSHKKADVANSRPLGHGGKGRSQTARTPGLK